ASAVRAKIELEGAELREDGRTMKDAYKAACAFAQHAAGAVMIEGGDDAAAIAGNSTIVPEINVQLQRRAPAAIIAPVGSGGLLSGLITGLNRCRWLQVPVIAVETHNTNSFQQALLSEPAHSSDSETAADAGSDRPTGQCKAQLGADLEHGHHPPPTPLAPSLKDEGDTDNEVRPGLSANPLVRSESENVMLCFSRVRLSSEAKTSEPTVATCLLSEFVCPSALELAQSHPVVPISVSEAMAVEACRRLLDDHQFLIEIGSAAALSIVGKGLVRQILPDLDSDDHVVVVVTGGANISLDRLDSCRQRFAYPAPTIAKSGLEIFMRMPDPAAAVSAASSVQSLGGSSPSPAPARATATSYTHTTSAVSVPPSVCAQSILSASPVQL
ncbi:catabolic L-serine/threonine dehydratase, partial [Coemansia thaxteri]